MSFARIKWLLLCLAVLLLPLKVSGASAKTVYFTFDDGPHPRHTEVILDILAKHNVKATFFTVGTNVKRFPYLIDREIAEGHKIANHSYDHAHMDSLDDEEFTRELTDWEAVMYEQHSYTGRLFRPPEGILSDSQAAILAELGYDTVLWTVDTRDWAHESVDDIVENVLSNVKDGSIVLFHDFVCGDSPTPRALEILIPKLKETGYSFEVISENKK